MTMRPSLIIGLGGSGSWTAAELKHRLIGDQRWVLLGQDPESFSSPAYASHSFPVQLQAVDVDKVNRPIVSGGVQLDRLTEDLGLDAPVGETLQHLKRLGPKETSAYRSVETWLPRSEASELEVNDAMTFMTSGAGQIRQFGRIAFFLDVLNKKQIIGRLGGAIGTLTAKTNPNDELSIYVVASVGGGAGAGLLIDTLLYLKDARTRLAGKISFRTIVFVVLPGAFKGVLEIDKFTLSQANGYGALRELDRLINASETVTVEWEPGKEVRLDGAVADQVYLLDGSRDLDTGQQLEGFAKPEQAFPVAVADAIYAHLFPSTGKVLVRDYPNLAEPLISGQPNRYSTFGTYLIQYDWERLLRSCTLKATRDVLRSRLAATSANTRALASQYLTGQAKDTFTNVGRYQELPFLLTEVMAAPEAALGELDPGSRWLEPATGAAPFPDTPTLRDFFPELKRITTRYDNQQVVDDTNVELQRFWGDEFGHWQDGEPQLYPVANTSAERCELEFVEALNLATAAVMNLGQGIGGMTAALGFVGEIDRILESYSGYLDKVALPGLASYEEAVQHAMDEMQDRNRFDDFKEQKDYLEAAQDLLHEQRRDQCLKRAKTLIGRFRYVTGEMKSHVESWQQNLEYLATEAETERLKIDNERVNANEPPLRRLVPLPGSTVEEGLYRESVGDNGPAGLPERLVSAAAGPTWSAHQSKDGTRRILWRIATGTTSSDDEPETLELGVLVNLLGPVFLPLRGRHVFDILEQEGEKASDLATEIRNGMARLAAFDQARQLQHTINNVSTQDWSYVFAAWRGEGPGSGLSTELRRLIDDAAAANAPRPTEDLAALPEEGSLPTNDKILAFSAKHLILLDAFRGVSMLTDAYRERREDNPSPHVLPEEKGAAKLEALSETLARDGFLAEPLDRIAAKAVPLCSDLIFLQQVAMALATERISFEVIDPFEKTGRWLMKTGSEEVELGTEPDFGEVVRRVAKGRDHGSKRSRQALRDLSIASVKTDAGKKALAVYALDGSSTSDVSVEVEAVLKAAAAAFVAGQ